MLSYTTVTVEDSATDPEDYIGGSVVSIPTLSALITSVTFRVSIIDDLVPELTETFRVDLNSVMSLPAGVTLDPSHATVMITDTDTVSVAIGFELDTYAVNEESGTVELTVKVLAGSLTSDVTLTYETLADTALAGSDYTHRTGTITLSSSDTEEKIVVSITDDNVPEFDEMFTVVLSGAPAGILLDPSRATVTITDTDTVVLGFRPAVYTVDENSGNVELTVEVIGDVLAETVTLTYTTTDAGATSPDDYTGGAFSLTLPALARSVAFTIPIVDDSDVEGDEMFTVALSSTLAGVSFNPTVATVTIIDNDVVIGFRPDAYEVDENSGTVELTVEVIDGVLTEDLVLTYTTADGTATSSDDYTGGVFSLTLPALARSVTFTIPIVDDSDVDPAETFMVNLGGAPVGVSFNPTSATVRIIDNDVVIGFDRDAYSVDEGAGTVELTVEVISGVLTEEVMLSYTTVEDSAVAPGDYTGANGGSIPTLSELVTRVTFRITIVDDMDPESMEQFFVDLGSVMSLPAGVTLDPSRSRATVTITDDDAPVPVVIGFRPDAYEVDESAGVVTVTVEVISGVLTQDVTLTYTTMDDSAVAPGDYTGANGGSIPTLSELVTRVTFRIMIEDDMDPESTERFFVDLDSVSLPAGITLDPSRSRATVTIIDNEQPGVPAADLTATLSVDSITLPEGATRQIEIRLSGKAPSDLTFTLVQISGSAAADVDYTLSPMEIVIAADEREVTVEIEANDDNAQEGDESFTLQLGSVLSRVAIGTTGTITVTIPENDQPTGPGPGPGPDPVVIGFEPVTYSVNEDAGPVVLTVKLLSGTLTETVTVSYATVDGGAVAGSDYTTMMSMLTLTPGASEMTIMVPIIDDNTNEPEEMFTVTLNGASGGATLNPSVATVTITDNDPPPMPEATEIEFVVLSASINEGEEYEIELRLVDSGGNPLRHSGEISATLEVYDAGTDSESGEYMFSSVVIIPAGEITGTATFSSIEDELVESNEDVTLRILDVTMVTSRNNRDMFTITVRDDDGGSMPPPPRNVTATLRMSTLNVAENETKELFIELSEAPVSDVTVKLTRVSGEATEGDDYSLSSQQLTFTPTGAQELTISISSIADMLYEGIETVEFELSVLSGMAVVGATDRVTVTIADIDTVPTLSLEPATPSVTEGQKTTVQAVLSGALDEDVEVSLAVTDDTADTADYTLPTTLRVTILAGETSVAFDITAAVDGIYEGDPETLILTLSTTNSTVLNGNLVRTLTIMDLDTQPTLSLEGVMNVSEGAGTLTLTARLDAALDIPVPIMLSTGGTATENDDYTFPSSLTIPAGVRVLTIAITIIDDDVHENDETVELTLSVPGGEVLTSTVMGTFTIMNDDSVPGVMVSTNTPVTEGGNIEVTITLDSSSSIATPVTLMIAPGLNAESDDFTGMDQLTMEIPAGMTSVTFIIGTEDDEFYEGAETIDIRPSVSGSTLPVENVVIMDNDDAPTVEFTMGTSTENEGDPVNVEVRLDGKRSESPVEVIFTVSGTATPGDDYTLPTMLRVTIPAKMRSGMITFAIQDENRYDGVTETVILTLTSASNAVGTIALGATTVHTLMIDDQQDQPTLSLELSAPSVTEGDSVTLMATLSGALDEELDVMLAVTTGGDANPDDYTLPTTLLATIQTGATTVAFVITANTDGIHEGDPETLILTLSTTSSAVMNGNLERTLMIMDLDTQPTLSLEGVMNVSEGAGTLTLTARLDGALDIPVPIMLSTSGAADAGDDYTFPSSLTIPAGTEVFTFTITITDDNVHEVDETVVLTLSVPGGEVKLGTVMGTFTIMNNDPVPGVTVSTNTPVMEGGNIEVTVTLDRTSSVATPVTLMIAPGLNAESDDFTGMDQLTMAIPAGMTEITFIIATEDDNLHEGAETINITPSVSGSTLPVESVVIMDNDDAPTIRFRASQPTTVAEGSSVNILVELVGAQLESALMVDFEVTMASTATAADYTLSTSVVIPARMPSAMITLTADNDDLYDGSAPETVVLRLKSASSTLGDILPSTPDEHIVMITDAQKTAPTLSLEQPAAVTEGNSRDVVARLTGDALDEDLVVLLEITGDTADYTTPTMLRVTIPAGEFMATFTIMATADGIYDGDPETLILNLSAPNGGVTNGVLQRMLTIMDLDTQPTLSLEGVMDVSEGAGTLTLTARLDGALDTPVQITLSTGGTATEGDDYTFPSSLTIPAGTEVFTFTITITDDDVYETDETVELTLSVPGGEVQLGTVMGTFRIMNNDPVPGVTVSTNTPVTEGSDIVVTVTLDRTSSAATPVTLMIAPGANADSDDYTGPSQLTGMIDAGETSVTFRIPTKDDELYEGAETIDITPSVSGSTLPVENVVITDNDDAPMVVFDTSMSTENEGATANVEVRLVGKLSESAVEVIFTVGGTATPGDDYTSPTMLRVTIPAKMRSAMITFAISTDTVHDGAAETVILTLTSASNAVGAISLGTTTVHTVMITDAQGPPQASFTDPSSTVAEGDTGDIEVTLDVESKTDTVITVTVSSTNADDGADYRVVERSITFAAGSTSKMISFEALTDNWYDGDGAETVELRLPDGSVHTVTIKDNESRPNVSLDAVAAVDEGAPRDVIARLSVASESDITVILTATNGTAESDDYTLADSSMVIPAGSLLATFTVNTNQDPLYEDNETVNLGLSIVSGEVDLGTPVTRVLTINNEDSVTIGFQETTYRVMEGAVNAMVTVAVLTGNLAPDVSIAVSYSTSNDTAMAGSEAGYDYTAVSGKLTFNSGNIQQTVTIPITNDEIYEDAEERFTIGLTADDPNSRLSVAPATSDILITDDSNDKPTLTIEIDGDTEIEGGVKELEEGESVVVTVRLSNMAANPIMISLTTLATTTSATIGTVESGDYTISPADRVIPAGATSITFALKALDDGQRERDEILALQASATDLESVSRELTIPGAVDAIIEPTRPPRTFLACETVDSGVQACVEVPKETISMSTVTLEIDKVDQDQKNNRIAPAELPPATALLDEILIWDILFVDDNGMVVETLSDTVKIELTASKAIVDEYGGPEGVSIATLHSGSTDWVILPTSYTSTVEMTPTGKEKYRFTAFSENFSLFTLIVPVTATLSASAASVQEGQSIDLVITLTAPAGEDIVFNLSKVGGDAVEGTHYSLPASITIIAGERTVRVPLTTIYDFNSRSEVLEIELSVRGTAAVVGLMRRATITIVDDPPPVATLEVEPDGIQEGDSTVVTYRLSHGRARVPIVVSLRDVAGTSDIRITPASITLAPGETTAEFNLMAICDILPEGVETLTLEAISTELGSVRTMLDVRDIMLGIESVTELDEDDRAVVRVRLSSAGCNPTTVSLTPVGGTADVDDYTLSQPSVTLDGADTIAEFRLTAHDDSQREPDETLVLVASVAGLNSVTATITIIDFVEDEGTGLPPTGGPAFPLWLVAVLLLTGLTLVVGTVYVVRRRPTAPRV